MSPTAVSSGAWSFDGQRALIFGAARGIGRAVALEFARRGTRVAIADIDSTGVVEVAQLIAATGGHAIGLSCDVSSDSSVREAAEEAERCLGAIDIVMNNVGVMLAGNPEDIPIAEWQRILDLNFMSVVRSLDVFLPKMLARGRGFIVNTASFAGLYPYAVNRLPYVASKAAVIALSESLALYLHPRGVRVSCLCPGPVMTRVTEGMKQWSTQSVMRGPGSQFKLITAEQTATILCEGMLAGRILIPTHDNVLEVMQQHARAPDRFIQYKLAEFARGDSGLPPR